MCAGGAGAQLSQVWPTEPGSHPLHTSPGAKVWGREGFSLFYFRSNSTENMTISQRTSISVLTCMTLNDCDQKKKKIMTIQSHDNTDDGRVGWPHPPQRQELCMFHNTGGDVAVWTGPLVVTIFHNFSSGSGNWRTIFNLPDWADKTSVHLFRYYMHLFQRNKFSPYISLWLPAHSN